MSEIQVTTIQTYEIEEPKLPPDRKGVFLVVRYYQNLDPSISIQYTLHEAIKTYFILTIAALNNTHRILEILGGLNKPEN